MTGKETPVPLWGPLHHRAHKFTSSGLIGSGNPWPCTTSEGAIQCERSFAVVDSDRQEFGKRLRCGCRDCSLYQNQCFHDIVYQSYPVPLYPCTMRQSAAILPCGVISIFRDHRCMRHPPVYFFTRVTCSTSSCL
jgi:hypothetical protein